MAKKRATKQAPEPATITALRSAIALRQWVFIGETLVFPEHVRGAERDYWHLTYWHARRQKLSAMFFDPEQIGVTPFDLPPGSPQLFAPFEGEYCDLSLPGRLVTGANQPPQTP